MERNRRVLNGSTLNKSTHFFGSQLFHDTNVRWLGTYARDQIRSLKNEKRPFALVVKNNVAAGPGEHWLVLYAPRDSFKIEMFDPFGLIPNIYSFDPSLIHFSSRSIHHLVARFADIMPFYLSILGLEIINLIIQSII